MPSVQHLRVTPPQKKKSCAITISTQNFCVKALDGQQKLLERKSGLMPLPRPGPCWSSLEHGLNLRGVTRILCRFESLQHWIYQFIDIFDSFTMFQMPNDTYVKFHFFTFKFTIFYSDLIFFISISGKFQYPRFELLRRRYCISLGPRPPGGIVWLANPAMLQEIGKISMYHQLSYQFTMCHCRLLYNNSDTNISNNSNNSNNRCK